MYAGSVSSSGAKIIGQQISVEKTIPDFIDYLRYREMKAGVEATCKLPT